MNMPLGGRYRLVDRGGPGLVCDESGVALGAVSLVLVGASARNLRGCDVRSPAEIDRIMRAAYGPLPEDVIQRLHRGLLRTAGWLEVGDLGRAAVEAVMLRLPNLTLDAMAKLARIADLEKGGAAWARLGRTNRASRRPKQLEANGRPTAAARRCQLSPRRRRTRQYRQAPNGPDRLQCWMTESIALAWAMRF